VFIEQTVQPFIDKPLAPFANRLNSDMKLSRRFGI
jgi:hypothetical protein